jgi:hypothetical protein
MARRRDLAARCARGLTEALAQGGRREDRVRAAPAVSCAICTRKCAHEHTGPAESIRPSLRNGLTAYGALALETNSSCLHRRRIDGFANPVGFAKTSADLTPATGARTTRFCRTQLPSPNLRPAISDQPKFWQRRLAPFVYTLSIAHGKTPCEHACAPTLPRPPHPIPTFRDDRDTPLVEGMRCVRYGGDLGETGRGIFLGRRLDGANRIDLVQEISVLAQRVCGRKCSTRSPHERSDSGELRRCQMLPRLYGHAR